MKVQSDWSPLFTHATDCFYDAAFDTLQDVANAAPYRSGQYVRKLKVNRRMRSSGPTATISSAVPYAGVLEYGGGPHAGWRHKGPHVQRANAPRPLQKGATRFGEHYTRRLQRTPIHSSAFVTGEFGRELGLPGLELGG